MPIGRLTACEWTHGRMNEVVFDDPSWQDVENAIRALDGQTRNDVYLTADRLNPDTWLVVGGGNGRYIVTGAIDVDKEFPALIDAGRPDEPQEALVVGGQEGLYPANWVLTFETALSGARAFYDAGGFQDNAPWVRV
jgi:hypothetical protein